MDRGLIGLWAVVLLSLCSAKLRDSQRPVFFNEPDVPFPPARPTARNVAAICSRGRGRARYPGRFFRPSGASHLRFRLSAIKRVESWYRACCGSRAEVAHHNSSIILCCALQAWKQALSQFCAEEHATKMMVYECCEDKGEARWTCFGSKPPNPDYKSAARYVAPRVHAEQGFAFNTSDCQD